MTGSRPHRDWSLSVAVNSAQGWECRNCGSSSGVEQAHVIGREHDYTPPVMAGWVMPGQQVDRVTWWRPGLVWPTRIVLLCGPATSTDTCHGKQHGRRLDVLRLLTVEQQVQAVADAGGIQAAYDRLTPGRGVPDVEVFTHDGQRFVLAGEPEDEDLLGGL